MRAWATEAVWAPACPTGVSTGVIRAQAPALQRHSRLMVGRASRCARVHEGRGVGAGPGPDCAASGPARSGAMRRP